MSIAATIDSTEYYLEENGEPKGPYTLAQLINMWRNGIIHGGSRYWTAADDEWRPVAEMKLDSTDAEVTNARIFRVLSSANEVSGPYSCAQLRRLIEQGHLSMTHMFWWPGISHWVDFALLRLSLEKDPNIEWALSKSLSAPSQIDPPPTTKQWTERKQTFATMKLAVFYWIILLAIIGGGVWWFLAVITE